MTKIDKAHADELGTSTQKVQEGKGDQKSQ